MARLANCAKLSFRFVPDYLPILPRRNCTKDDQIVSTSTFFTGTSTIEICSLKLLFERLECKCRVALCSLLSGRSSSSRFSPLPFYTDFSHYYSALHYLTYLKRRKTSLTAQFKHLTMIPTSKMPSCSELEDKLRMPLTTLQTTS